MLSIVEFFALGYIFYVGRELIMNCGAQMDETLLVEGVDVVFLAKWEWTEKLREKSSGCEITNVQAVLMNVQVRVRMLWLVKWCLQAFLYLKLRLLF